MFYANRLHSGGIWKCTVLSNIVTNYNVSNKNVCSSNGVFALHISTLSLFRGISMRSLVRVHVYVAIDRFIEITFCFSKFMPISNILYRCFFLKSLIYLKATDYWTYFVGKLFIFVYVYNLQLKLDTVSVLINIRLLVCIPKLLLWH